MHSSERSDTTLDSRTQFEELLALHAPYIHPKSLQLSTEEEYAELLQSIHDHKYLVNEKIPFVINMEQATFSWYENVYHPLTQAIDEEGLAWAFPEATAGELFLWVSRHWHFLKQQQGERTSPEEAVRDFGQRYGAGLFNRILFRIRSLAA